MPRQEPQERKGSHHRLGTAHQSLRAAAITVIVVMTAALAPSPQNAAATPAGAAQYDIGAPVLQRIFVDPVNGSDANSGANAGAALRTITAAWARVPSSLQLSGHGYEIMLLPGTYPESSFPPYWESRWGTRNFPIIIRAANGPGTAVLTAFVNMYDLRYVYLIDLVIAPNPGGDAFHCERCDYLLIRGGAMSGGSAREAHETIKINQSTYVFIEGVDISSTYENAIDFVAVQHGHIIRNRIHDAGDWCIYLKGGSADLLVEGNRIFNCGTGGFTAGQGSGLEYMVSPWLHYEAYDIKFVNNVIHDTEGAAFGVNGGYNVLLAYNTAFRVGSRSHLIEIVHGHRSCDGNVAACAAMNAAGAWGPASPLDEPVRIPSRNVLVFNNVIYNPAGFHSAFSHLTVHSRYAPQAGTNVPSPSFADENLVIRGNVIWNGPGTALSLGIGEGESGCGSWNPTCNVMQVLAENSINTLNPTLADPEAGDFRPAPESPLLTVSSMPAPAFSGGDRPTPPLAPLGTLDNSVQSDRNGAPRPAGSPPGAYVGAAGPSNDPPIDGVPPQPPPGAPPQPSDGAPAVTAARLRSTRVKAGQSIEVTAKAVDDIGVLQVVIRFGDQYSVMRLRRGTYTGSVRAPRSTPTGLYPVEVIAIDTSGQVASRLAGFVRLRGPR